MRGMRLALLFPLAAGLALMQDAPVPPAIGAKVADFRLPGVDGQQHSLRSFKDKKAFVIIFVGTECPLANLYFPTLAEMQKKYAKQGVQFLAINSNDQDTMPEVVIHARERQLPFPVLKDADQKAADALGAKRTPETFLLDSKYIIRYRGRIDDQYGYTYRRAAPTRTELKDAIEELLAGKPITTPVTECRGCLIGRGKKEGPTNPTR
jgi:peroxiredoxin